MNAVYKNVPRKVNPDHILQKPDGVPGAEERWQGFGAAHTLYGDGRSFAALPALWQSARAA
jgi:hypothetical protein